MLSIAKVLMLSALACVLPGHTLASSATPQTVVGQGHSCVLVNSRVTCWGTNAFGALGLGFSGNIGDNERPVDFVPPPGRDLFVDLSGVAGSAGTVKALTAGSSFTCAIVDTDDVVCWGRSSNGELGLGNTDTIGDGESPTAIVPLPTLGGSNKVKAIASGESHSCVIMMSDDVVCWGSGADGRLGYGNINNIGDDETPATLGAVPLPTLGGSNKAKSIHAGHSHTCAIMMSDDVVCWGDNSNGKLGYGSVIDVGDGSGPAVSAIGAVQLPTLGGSNKVKAIDAGHLHTCAIMMSDDVVCWGSGDDGRLGYSNTDAIGDNELPSTVGAVPLPTVSGSNKVKALALGTMTTCVVMNSDDVVCWGSGGNGVLGHGNTDSIGDDETVSIITALPTLGSSNKVTSLSGGFLHVCAVMQNNDVVCWGRNMFGSCGYSRFDQIGDNETLTSLIGVSYAVPPAPTGGASGSSGTGGKKCHCRLRHRYLRMRS